MSLQPGLPPAITALELETIAAATLVGQGSADEDLAPGQSYHGASRNS